jgi:hypothetical protein
MRAFLPGVCLPLILTLRLGGADARVEKWAQALASSDPRSSLAAGYDLHPARPEDETALVRSVLPLLSDSHENVRAYAASFLGEHRVLEAESIRSLAGLLDSSNLKTREHAAIALAQWGPPAVRILLTKLTAAQDQSCAAPKLETVQLYEGFHCSDYAYASLFEIGPAALLGILSNFHSLDDLGEGYSAALLRAFALEKPGTFVASLFGARAFSRSEIDMLLNTSLLPLVPALINRFERPDRAERMMAAFALSSLYLKLSPANPSDSAKFQDIPLAPQLTSHSGEQGVSDSYRRERAQLLDHATAVRFLSAAIGDKQNPWRLRQSMAPELRDLAGAQNRQTIGRALAKILVDAREAWPLREAAGQALNEANLADFASLSSLRDMLRDSETPWPLKTVAATIVGREGVAAAAAAPELQALVSSSDRNTLRLAAARALGHLGNAGLKALAALLHDGDEDIKILAVDGLSETGPGGAALRGEAFVSSSPRVQKAMIVAGLNRGVSDMTRQAYQPEARLRATPAETEVKPAGADLTHVSIEQLRETLARADGMGTVAAADELARRGPAGIRILSQSLSLPTRANSAAAIAALSHAGIAGRSAVPELCGALYDDRLQAGAARALWIIGGYTGDCERVLTTVLKDGLIHDYITADLDARPEIARWTARDSEPIPSLPADRFRIDDLLIDRGGLFTASLSDRLYSLQGNLATEKNPLPTLDLPSPSISSSIDLKLAGDASVYDAYKRIVNAFADYRSVGLFAAPRGFTLITRMEQIDPAWKPLASKYRWRSERPSVSLLSWDFFREMLFAPPGDFRLIAVMVTTDLTPKFKGDEWSFEEAANKFQDHAAHVLPDSFHDIPYSGHYCHILIYNYSKPLDHLAKLLGPTDGVGDVQLQLAQAGVWSKLQ